MQAVRDTAASGLKIIQYDSGHADRVETAVRRAVLTGVGQTCREIGKMNAEENGCDLMELSAHAGARPEHAVWQGQLVDLTGRRTGEIIDGKRVLSLSDIGYGLVTGFGGANCRHDWYPYFEGYSVPLYTQEYLEEINARNISYNGKMYTRYEISQMQRAGERKIRSLKRRCVTYDEAVKNAPDDSVKTAMQKKFQDSAVKLKAAEQKLSEFCKETGQDRGRFREQVVGFGRSEAQRAVWANKNAQKALTSDVKSGKIKKSGALNHNSDEAYEHAERYYESVRKMKTDVKRISQNTGYSEKFIQQIKDFVFVEEHDLGDNGIRRFYADYKMAQTWQRLIVGKNIQKHDITFLKHEEMERKLMQQGYSQEEAHNITSETYNYAKEAIKYYAEIEKHKKK